MVDSKTWSPSAILKLQLQEDRNKAVDNKIYLYIKIFRKIVEIFNGLHDEKNKLWLF